MNVWFGGFPAKSTWHGLLAVQVPDLIEFAGEAVVVRILRIRQCLQVFKRYGFQQTHADHLRSHPRRHQQVFREWAIVRVLDPVDRFS